MTVLVNDTVYIVVNFSDEENSEFQSSNWKVFRSQGHINGD